MRIALARVAGAVISKSSSYNNVLYSYRIQLTQRTCGLVFVLSHANITVAVVAAETIEIIAAIETIAVPAPNRTCLMSKDAQLQAEFGRNIPYF